MVRPRFAWLGLVAAAQCGCNELIDPDPWWPLASTPASSSAATSGTVGAGGAAGYGGEGGGACEPAQTKSCYDGAAATLGVGVCKGGVSTCTAERAFGPCEGQVLPSTEVCDTIEDESCDGAAGCTGTALWAFTYGSSLDDRAHRAAFDDEGNLFVVGDRNLMGPDYTLADAWVAKLDPSGKPQFVSLFGDAQTVGPQILGDVAWHPLAGGVVVVGWVGASVDLGGGKSLQGGNDALVMMLGPTGDVVWARLFGGTGVTRGSGVAVADDGSIYVIGYFNGTLVLDGAATLVGQEPAGDPEYDAFVARLDPDDGDPVWAARAGGPGHQIAVQVALDPSANVVAGGYFSGTLVAATTTLVCNGEDDIFVWRLSGQDGTTLSATGAGGTGHERSFGVSRTSAGVLVSGQFGSAMDLQPLGTLTPTNLDAFAVLIDGTGAAVDVLTAKGDSQATFHDAMMDGAGNWLVGGHFFDNGITFPGRAPAVGAGLRDAFVAKTLPGGEHAWTRVLQSPEDQWVIGLATGPSGEIAAVGYSQSELTVDDVQIANAGNLDGYVLMLSP